MPSQYGLVLELVAMVFQDVDTFVRKPPRPLSCATGRVHRRHAPNRRPCETLAAGAGAPRDVVERFWDFMLDKLCLGAVHYDAVAAAPAAVMAAQSAVSSEA